MFHLISASAICEVLNENLESALRNNRATHHNWSVGDCQLLMTVGLPQGPVTSQTIKIVGEYSSPKGISTETFTVPYSRICKTDFTVAAKGLLRGFIRQV